MTRKTTRKTTRIDMHVHTPGSDGHGSPADFVKAIKAAKLDGVCLTDHHSTHNAKNLKIAEACRAAGLLVIHGSEYSTADGHLLIYGVTFEELQMGFYPPMQEVISEVNRRGGVAIPAHPYKGYRRHLGDKVKKLRGVKAYEVANGQVAVRSPEHNAKAVAAAEEKGRRGVGGSDAHFASDIGVTYTEFKSWITTEKEFLAALRRGEYRAVTSRKRVAESAKMYWGAVQKLSNKKMIPSDHLLGLDNYVDSRQVSEDGDPFLTSWSDSASGDEDSWSPRQQRRLPLH